MHLVGRMKVLPIFGIALLCGLSDMATAEAQSERMWPVYMQRKTITNYQFQANLPPMSEFTICFWMERYPEDVNNKDNYLVSLATPDSGNELLIGWVENGDFGLYIQDKEKILLLPAGETMASLWTGWNKHCFTWRAGGQIKWYTDRDVPGKVELISTQSAFNVTIRSGGYLVLLQDQDAVGSSFDIKQVGVGKMAGFNMWDYEMSTADEINFETCEGGGNVVSQETLQNKGSNSELSREYPQCYDMLPLFVQRKTISSYLYQSSMPAMSAFTTCFWLERYPEDVNRRDNYLVSLATSDSDNELLLGWNGTGRFALYIQNQEQILELPAGQTMENLFSGWNKHCITWTAGGKLKWYTDVHINGVVELVSTTNAVPATVRAGGYMVLLQEQDSVGGNLHVSQVTVGKIAEFNMWNFELPTADLVNSVSCGGRGNVATWDTLREKGNSGYYRREFPQCNA